MNIKLILLSLFFFLVTYSITFSIIIYRKLLDIEGELKMLVKDNLVIESKPARRYISSDDVERYHQDLEDQLNSTISLSPEEIEQIKDKDIFDEIDPWDIEYEEDEFLKWESDWKLRELHQDLNEKD